MSLKRNELLESVKKKLSIQVNSYRHFHIKSEGNKERINNRHIVYIYVYVYVCVYIYIYIYIYISRRLKWDSSCSLFADALKTDKNTIGAQRSHILNIQVKVL